MEYKKRKEATKELGICYKTLYKMAENKEIDTIKIGENTVYNVDKYLKERKIIKKEKKKICYCSVSNEKEKENLGKQVKYMKEKFPTHEIIEDIGIDHNSKRKGLEEILEKAINGEIEELVVAYKDRLSIFGYEMIEWIISKYSNGKIIIVNKEEILVEELMKDMVSVINTHVEKINKLRKYKGKTKEV